MAVLTAAIMSRFETVIEATAGSPRGGFRKAMNRFDFKCEPEGGRDGLYRLETTSGIGGVRQVFGTGEAVRHFGALAVQVAYFRGGGSAGGTKGGDRKSTNRRAIDDVFALVESLEDPGTYDAQNTGIRTVTFMSFRRIAELPRSEIWETAFNVEWQATVVTL